MLKMIQTFYPDVKHGSFRVENLNTLPSSMPFSCAGGAIGAPGAGEWVGIQLNNESDKDSAIQFAFSADSAEQFTRRCVDGAWSAWAGRPASQITVKDVEGYYGGDDLEEVLAEIGAVMELVDDLANSGVDTTARAGLAEVTSQLDATKNDVARIDDALAPLLLNVDSWTSVQQAMRLGLAPKAFPDGTQFQAPHAVYGNVVWEVVARNAEKKPGDPTAPTMTLLMRDVIYTRQFDAVNSLCYCADGLPAGTYNFSLLAGYDVDYGGGKTYQFTLTNPVPAGGVLVFPWSYNVQASTVKVSSYPTRVSTVAIESVSVSEGSGGTSLGTADGLTPNMNHTHRIRYGSNNWAESAARQWLNSDKVANAWWEPQTIFDRPPAYANAAGFLGGFGEDFLAVLGKPAITTARNTVFEVGGTTGGSYTTADTFFLASMKNVGFGQNNSLDEGVLWDAYDGAQNADRIKYDIASAATARHWWLRSPHPTNANFVRSAITDGSLNYNYAITALGLAAACVIM